MAIIEQKLEAMGIILQDPPVPNHPILRCKQSGNLLFVSGHGTAYKGKVGADLTVEDGYVAAREAAIHCLEAIKQHVGDLDKVTNFLKVFGMVNSAPDFIQQPAVINGVSDLLIEVFGQEIGSHARSAVGMVSLPNGIAVEVEMIAEIAG